MQEVLTVRGRELRPDHLEFIRQLLRDNPSWSRRRLSQELCKAWNWRNAKGDLKDMASRSIACLLFGSSAWSAKGRDAFIGWDKQARRRNLNNTTNNTRFLILPWVRVPHLASHVPGLIARRIRFDWQVRYGHGIELLETFVEKERFEGTCYKAANWKIRRRHSGAQP